MLDMLLEDEGEVDVCDGKYLGFIEKSSLWYDIFRDLFVDCLLKINEN